MKKLEEMTNEELAMLYVDGNNRAFDLLLVRNQERLFSYILFVVKDRNLADDIFQEIFIKVITKLNEGYYTTSGKFSSWLMTIAHNDFDNEMMFERNLLERNIEHKYVNAQVMNDVKRMMDMLPTLQREVVYMRFYQQLSFKEIAETTNVSVNTALGRMRYAILNLRRMAKTHGITLQLD